MDQNWEDLKKSILCCQKCKLCETRKNVVFGVGSRSSEVMFVGEGPGEQEDLTGNPFVGRAGQLLDKMLKVVDLDRNKNIFITNIVKCRPPGNRDPKPEEQQTCIQWLRMQTKLVDPKIIVCLGRIAAQKLIREDFKITKEHGIFYPKGNLLMMATLHPSALLRNPLNKPSALQDYINLREKIKEVCNHIYQ